MQGDSSEGMVVDFSVLKGAMLDYVAEPWDHALLLWENDRIVAQRPTLLDALPDTHKTVFLPCIPTVENLVVQAAELLKQPLSDHGLTLVNVRLYETPNCWADYKPD